jgi:hypothetical protein
MCMSVKTSMMEHMSAVLPNIIVFHSYQVSTRRRNEGNGAECILCCFIFAICSEFRCSTAGLLRFLHYMNKSSEILVTCWTIFRFLDSVTHCHVSNSNIASVMTRARVGRNKTLERNFEHFTSFSLLFPRYVVKVRYNMYPNTFGFKMEGGGIDIPKSCHDAKVSLCTMFYYVHSV